MSFPPLPSFVWPTLSARMAQVLALGAICCAVEVILSASQWGLVGSARWRALALQNGAFWPGLLRSWQPNYPAQPALMFATYAFLHTGPLHLLGNMTALLWLGPHLVRRLGQAGFATLWLLSAAGGAFGFALLSDTPAPMVGASGAVFGLLGGFVMLDYRDRRDVSAVLNMTGALALLNLITLVLEGGVLAWQTHLGGYAVGALIVAALGPDTDPEPPRAER